MKHGGHSAGGQGRVLQKSPLSSLLHPDIMKLTCRHFPLYPSLPLCAVILDFGIDSPLIVISYVMIWTTTVTATSQGQHLKALRTCISHVSAVMASRIPTAAVSTVHQLEEDLPPFVLMSHIYLSVPPLLNSFICSVSSKDV